MPDLDGACRVLRRLPSLAADCRVAETGVHRPRRPLTPDEAIVMVQAWHVCDRDMPDRDCRVRGEDESSVAEWIAYCLRPLGYWPDGADAVGYGEPVLP